MAITKIEKNGKVFYFDPKAKNLLSREAAIKNINGTPTKTTKEVVNSEYTNTVGFGL